MTDALEVAQHLVAHGANVAVEDVHVSSLRCSRLWLCYELTRLGCS